MASIKALMEALLTYPVNVILVIVFVCMLAYRVLGIKGYGAEVAKIKDEVNELKSKQGVEALRKELKEVEE